MGIAVTPMFDRKNKIPLPKFQLGFVNFIVRPLFIAIDRLSAVDASEALESLEANVARWHRIDEGKEEDMWSPRGSREPISPREPTSPR